MVLRTKNEISTSIKTNLETNSPQIRIDANNGPFFYLSREAVAQPLADASADVERMALLSTLQFPAVASEAEILATGRAFGQALGSGGFSRGVAFVNTSRRPQGNDAFTVSEGDTFATATVGGQVFEAVESRSLTAANVEAFYNPATRRYELPVTVQAVSAGTTGNIAARTLTLIAGGATDFEGVDNLVSFSGGTAAQTTSNLYARTQQIFGGLDNFSRGGLLSRVQNVDPDRVLAAALTYSTEYPILFHRLPDVQAIDVWVLNNVQSTLVTETFVATAGQTQYVLSNGPVLGIDTAQINGASDAATLTLDDSLELGASTRESSFVTMGTAAVAGDIVDISYTYDAVPNTIQTELDGFLDADVGALFDADVLVRHANTTPVTVTVTGTVLGTFDPTLVENEITVVVGNYIANGLSDAPLLGGSRSPADLRDVIRSQVPGVAGLNIPIFSRKSVSPLVETIDILRNSRLSFEASTDLIVTFT